MIRRTSIFLVVGMLLMLSVMQVIKAQDEGAADEVAGFVVIPAESGTLEEGDDEGVYELTLEEVAPNSVWVLSAPAYFSGWSETTIFASQWAANSETPLTATVLLKTEEVTLRMTASQPAYDPMGSTLTLQVSAVEVFPADEEVTIKGSGVPDEFETADLSIVIDSAFSAGLVEGDAILKSEGRVGEAIVTTTTFALPTKAK